MRHFFALYFLTTRCCQSTHIGSLSWRSPTCGPHGRVRQVCFPSTLLSIPSTKPQNFGCEGSTAAYQFEENSNQCEQSTNMSKSSPGQWVAHWLKACCVTLLAALRVASWQAEHDEERQQRVGLSVRADSGLRPQGETVFIIYEASCCLRSQ